MEIQEIIRQAAGEPSQAWIGAAVTGALGLAGAWWGNKQRKKEAEKSHERSKELMELSREQQMKTWNETNYKEQKSQMVKAGLNPGLMYGMSGGGGATTGGGGGGAGAQAQVETPDVAGATQAGMAMQLGMAQKKQIEEQTKLTEAQRQNTEADTAKKTAETPGIQESTRGAKILNDFNESVAGINWSKASAERDIQETLAEEVNAKWLTFKEAAYGDKTFDSKESLAHKVTQAGLLKVVEELKAAKTENNIKRAEEAIKEFEAGLAKEGISPNAPWGVKLLTDVLNKLGWIDKVTKWAN